MAPPLRPGSRAQQQPGGVSAVSRIQATTGRSQTLQRQGVVSASGTRAVGRLFGDLAGKAQSIFQDELRAQAKKVKKASIKAGRRDVSAVKELADIDLPSGDTVADEAYRRSAIQAMQARVSLSIREDVDRLSQEYADNPGSFLEIAEANAVEMASNLDPEFREQVLLGYRERAGRAAIGIRENVRRADIDRMRADVQAEVEARQQDIEEMARSGDLEGAEKAATQFGEFLMANRPVAAGGAGVFTFQEIDSFTRGAADSVPEQAVLGEFSRIEGWRKKRHYIQQFRDEFDETQFDSETHEKLARQMTYQADQERAFERIETDREERIEREAEERAEIEKEAAFSGYLSGILTGKVDEESISLALENREIDGKQGERLIRALRQQSKSKPDPEIAAQIVTDAAKGEPDTVERVAEALASGEIDKETAAEAVTTAREVQQSEPTIASGMDMIEQALPGLPGPERLKVARDYRRRLAADGDVDPIAAAKDVIDSHQSAANPPQFLKGSLDAPDLVASRAAIIQAVEAGELSQEQAAEEIQKIISMVQS